MAGPESYYLTLSPQSRVTQVFSRKYANIEIVSMDGLAGISVIASPTEAQKSSIQYAQDGTWPIPAAPCSRVIPAGPDGPTEVLLISDGSPTVCVLAY